MSSMMGWVLVLIGLVLDYFVVKSTIKSYHHMKEAKRKAEIWGARF